MITIYMSKCGVFFLLQAWNDAANAGKSVAKEMPIYQLTCEVQCSEPISHVFIQMWKIFLLLWFTCKGIASDQYGPKRIVTVTSLLEFFFRLLLKATVQMCITEIWWITCCCTVCWLLYPSQSSTHTESQTLRPWASWVGFDKPISPFDHRLGGTATAVGVHVWRRLQFFKDLYPCNAAELKVWWEPSSKNATIKILLLNSPSSFCFNFLYLSLTLANLSPWL